MDRTAMRKATTHRVVTLAIFVRKRAQVRLSATVAVFGENAVRPTPSSQF
jgi:hypothetical protein